jgi:integrase
MKRTLNDRLLKALKPAPAGKRYDIMDSIVPGLGIRVTDKGRRTFCLRCRYPGQPHANRRALGEYGAINLDTARTKARAWLELIKKGVDPQYQEARERDAALRAQELTVAAVAADFFVEKLSGERRGSDAERIMRREFLPVWGHRPISDITDLDILTIIRAKKRTAPAEARNMLALAKRFFAWVVEQRSYGLKTSPVDGLKPGKIVGDKKTGTRVLSDLELFALWRTAARLPYPIGPAYKMLVLSGLRVREAADAHWGEFDLPGKVWVIPASRMKGLNHKARPHAVPLTDDMLAVLKQLPRFDRGDFLFSTTFGASPVWMTSKLKDRLDRRMLRTLKALARQRGEDPMKVALPPWKNHDIRRTLRTQLSRLKVSEEAREAVLAHTRPGIKGTYDLHDYFDEKCEALTAWGGRLRQIVNPPASNILPLHKRRDVLK